MKERLSFSLQQAQGTYEKIGLRECKMKIESIGFSYNLLTHLCSVFISQYLMIVWRESQLTSSSYVVQSKMNLRLVLYLMINLLVALSTYKVYSSPTNTENIHDYSIIKNRVPKSMLYQMIVAYDLSGDKLGHSQRYSYHHSHSHNCV